MKNHEVLSCIDHVPIFDALNPNEKNDVTLIAKHEHFAKNDFIYMAGDELEALYIIHKGSVKIIRYTADGKEQVLRVLKHGDFFGETALFGNKKVNDYAEIIDDAVVCKIEQKMFNTIINRTPTIATKMLTELSTRLNEVEATLTFNNLKTADAKLAKYLLDNSKDNIVYFQTTKKNISALLGITPETFSRRLQHFAKQGYVKVITNRQIHIVNRRYLDTLVFT